MKIVEKCDSKTMEKVKRLLRGSRYQYLPLTTVSQCRFSRQLGIFFSRWDWANCTTISNDRKKSYSSIDSSGPELYVLFDETLFDNGSIAPFDDLPQKLGQVWEPYHQVWRYSVRKIYIFG